MFFAIKLSPLSAALLQAADAARDVREKAAAQRADAAPTIVSRHAKLACRYLRSALRAGTWSRLRLHFVRILSHSTCSP